MRTESPTGVGAQRLETQGRGNEQVTPQGSGQQSPDPNPLNPRGEDLMSMLTSLLFKMISSPIDIHTRLMQKIIHSGDYS